MTEDIIVNSVLVLPAFWKRGSCPTALIGKRKFKILCLQGKNKNKIHYLILLINERCFWSEILEVVLHIQGNPHIQLKT